MHFLTFITSGIRGLYMGILSAVISAIVLLALILFYAGDRELGSYGRVRLCGSV